MIQKGEVLDRLEGTWCKQCGMQSAKAAALQHRPGRIKEMKANEKFHCASVQLCSPPPSLLNSPGHDVVCFRPKLCQSLLFPVMNLFAL